MTDNYVLALEKDRDTRLAELERCRSEVERFVGEVERLMRERDETQRALLLEQQVRESHRESADDLRRKLDLAERERDGEREEREKVSAFKRQREEEYEVALRERDEARANDELLRRSYTEEESRADMAEHERDEWKARAEAAEADNAAVLERLHEESFRVPCPGCGRQRVDVDGHHETCDLWAFLNQPHPGAALLALHNAVRQYQYRDEADTLATFRRLMEERRRIAECIPPEQSSALMADLRAAESLASAWEKQHNELMRLHRSRGDRLDVAIAVVEAARRAHRAMKAIHNEDVPIGFDVAQGDLGQALAAYDAAKEGK